MDIVINTELLNLLLGSGILLVVIKGVFNLGEFSNRFKNLEKTFAIFKKDTKNSLGSINNRIDQIDKDITRYKTTTTNLLKKYGIEEEKNKFEEIRSNFEVVNSPLGLKSEYKKLLQQSGVIEEVKKNKNKILSWLKRQRPKNGLEAQDKLVHLAMSGKIEKYVDLADYYDLLYKQGFMLDEANTIVGLFLFEEIIPDFLKK